MSDDETPTLPADPRRAAEQVRRTAPGSTSESRFPVEVTVLGLAIVALLVAAVVTLLSINGGSDGASLTIGSEPDRPPATFDASLNDNDSDADNDDDGGEESESQIGRDISITDEPIVIDADGNVVDPAGGNGGAALPSEAAATDGDAGALDLPDDVFTGAEQTDGSEPDAPSATDAQSNADEADGDGGINLLGGDDPEDKLMPDLICRGLQAAQDEIQDRGVFGSKSRDATGQGRRQLWDRNWIVVAQDPEPGEKIGEFEAVLYVVKKSDDENTCD